MNRCVIS